MKYKIKATEQAICAITKRANLLAAVLQSISTREQMDLFVLRRANIYLASILIEVQHLSVNQKYRTIFDAIVLQAEQITRSKYR